MIFILFLTFMLGFGRNIQMGIAVQAAAVMIRDGVDVTIGSFRYVAAGENLARLVGAMSAVSSTIILLTVSAINKKWGRKENFYRFRSVRRGCRSYEFCSLRRRRKNLPLGMGYTYLSVPDLFFFRTERFSSFGNDRRYSGIQRMADG